MLLIAIDPGKSGAVVWVNDENGIVNSKRMPDTLGDLWELLHTLSCSECKCIVEKVGTYMPGNSGPSAATFAEHVGALKMGLIAAGISHEIVTPRKWQDLFIGKQNYAKIPADTAPDTKKRILAERKHERKRKIKEKAQQVYPNVTVTLTNADALGMLYYGQSLFSTHASAPVVASPQTSRSASRTVSPSSPLDDEQAPQPSSANPQADLFSQ